jgi:hypothetical protein
MENPKLAQPQAASTAKIKFLNLASMIRVHVRLPRVGSGYVYYKNAALIRCAILRSSTAHSSSRKKIPFRARRKKMSDAPEVKPVKPVKPATKPAKARKPKTAEHPTYSEMVTAAIAAQKERNGSSRQAILKYITANYKVNESASTHLKGALRRMTDKKELVQTKGVGASGSFKLNKDAPKKKKAPSKAKAPAKPKPKVAAKPATSKKTTTKKPAAKKSSTAAKKPAAKKPAAKKSGTPKKVAKKPAAKKPASKASTPKKTAPKPKTKKPAPKPASKGKKSPAKKAAKKPAKK